MSNTKLGLNIIDYAVSDFLDVIKTNENEYQIPLVVLFERTINGVKYAYVIYDSYLSIIAKNELTNNYLPIGPDNIEDLLMKLVTNEKDILKDALDAKSSKQITIEGSTLYLFDVVESAKAINAFNDDNESAIAMPIDKYKLALSDMINKSIKSDGLANVTWKEFSDTLKEMLVFGKDNKPEIVEDGVSTSYVDIAIAYYLQLVFTDRILRMNWVVDNFAKRISEDK